MYKSVRPNFSTKYSLKNYLKTHLKHPICKIESWFNRKPTSRKIGSYSSCQPKLHWPLCISPSYFRVLCENLNPLPNLIGPKYLQSWKKPFKSVVRKREKKGISEKEKRVRSYSSKNFIFNFHFNSHLNFHLSGKFPLLL